MEYKIRADEIKALIGEGRYAEAVKIADTIDWKRVKSVTMLCTISDLYKINRRFQESKDVLLMAYDRHPTGRAIVYSLCELAIKMGEFVQAVEYYKEFVRIAPRDTGRYILQYKLYEAQEVSLEERIAVLEEFKKHDYRERWAYELAYLYHRVGLTTECIEECDEMFLWFGDGRYVMKALELKALHEPLSPEQQDRYIRYKQSHGGIVDKSIVSEKDEVGKDETRTVEIKQPTKEIPKVTDQMLAGYNAQSHVHEVEEDLEETREFVPGEISFASAAKEPEPGKEEPKERDFDEIVYPHISEIKEPSVDVSTYNTINLQESLAESLREVIGDDDTKTFDAVPEVPAEGQMQPITEEIFEDTGEVPAQEEYPLKKEHQTEEIFFESEGALGMQELSYKDAASADKSAEASQEPTEGSALEAALESELRAKEAQEAARQKANYGEEQGVAAQGGYYQGQEPQAQSAYYEEQAPQSQGEYYQEQQPQAQSAYYEEPAQNTQGEYYGEQYSEPQAQSAYYEEQAPQSQGEYYQEQQPQAQSAYYEEPAQNTQGEYYGEQYSEPQAQSAYYEEPVQYRQDEYYGEETQEAQGGYYGEPGSQDEKAALEAAIRARKEQLARMENGTTHSYQSRYSGYTKYGRDSESIYDTSPKMGIEIKYGGMGPILGEEKKPAVAQPAPLEEEVPGAVIHPNASYPMHSHFESMLSQESDGQITMAVEPEPMVEKQITGQISIAEYLSNWEQYKKEQQQKQFERVKQRVADETGDMFAMFDEKTKAGLQEKIEKAISEAIRRESYNKASGRGNWSLRKEDVINAAVDEVIESEGANEPLYDEPEDEPMMDEEPEAYAAEAQPQAEADYATGTLPSSEVAAQATGTLPTAEVAAQATGTLSTAEVASQATGTLPTAEAASQATGTLPTGEAESATTAATGILPTAEVVAQATGTLPTSEVASQATGTLPIAEAAAATTATGTLPTAETAAATTATGTLPTAKAAAATTSTGTLPTAEAAAQATGTLPTEQAAAATGSDDEDAAGEGQDTSSAQTGKKHIGNRELEERVRTMTPEEKELFGPYIHHKKSRRQIINAIDNLSMDPFSGNAIVTGEEGAGTVSLAKGLIKAMQVSDANFSGKVAKITANTLNKKSTAGIFDKLANGALIIQRAADMTQETVGELIKILQQENKGLVIVMEDAREDMDRFLDKNPSLKQSFNVRVDIEALDDDALVAYARQYAVEKGYTIDNLGILALHTRISERQTLDHDVTVSEVKDIVDDAIYYAEKRTVGHFVDILVHKRYDENDMIILREKDFMHE